MLCMFLYFSFCLALYCFSSFHNIIACKASTEYDFIFVFVFFCFSKTLLIGTGYCGENQAISALHPLLYPYCS